MDNNTQKSKDANRNFSNFREFQAQPVSAKQVLLINNYTRSSDYSLTQHCYVDICGGDLIAGILLTRIIYWFSLGADGTPRVKHRDSDGRSALIKCREDWKEECRISPKQYDRASKILQKMGIIETQVRKNPFDPEKTCIFHFFNETALQFHLLKHLQSLGIIEKENPEENPASQGNLPLGNSGITVWGIPSIYTNTIDKECVTHATASQFAVPSHEVDPKVGGLTELQSQRMEVTEEKSDPPKEIPIQSNLKRKKKRTGASSSSLSDDQASSEDFVSKEKKVRMKKEHYDNLIALNGQAAVDWMVNHLEEQCLLKGYTYKRPDMLMRPKGCANPWVYMDFVKAHPQSFKERQNEELVKDLIEKRRIHLRYFFKNSWDEIGPILSQRGISLKFDLKFVEIGNKTIYYHSAEYPKEIETTLKEFGVHYEARGAD